MAGATTTPPAPRIGRGVQGLKGDIVKGGEGAMMPKQQIAYQHPCRRPMEMAIQGISIPRFGPRASSTTVTITWGGRDLPASAVWHAEVTVVGPQGSRRLQDWSASVHSRPDSSLGTRWTVWVCSAVCGRADGGVHVSTPFTEETCRGLPTRGRETVQKSRFRTRTRFPMSTMTQLICATNVKSCWRSRYRCEVFLAVVVEITPWLCHHYLDEPVAP